MVSPFIGSLSTSIQKINCQAPFQLKMKRLKSLEQKGKGNRGTDRQKRDKKLFLKMFHKNELKCLIELRLIDTFARKCPT